MGVFNVRRCNIIFPGSLFGQGLAYHIQWLRNGSLWRMKLPDIFSISAQIGQYVISFIFFAMMFWFAGKYTMFHIIGTNLAFFIGLAPDHDLFPTHLEIDKFDSKIMDWGETQVRGSANFCNSYKLYTRFMGGINNQIEHHLFPSICNHYLPEIVPIVKQTCQEFNIPYNHIDNPKEVFDSLCKTYFDVYEKDKTK